MSSTAYYAKPNEAVAFAKSLLVKSGLPDEDATIMADCLVLADTRGVVSFCLFGFIESWSHNASMIDTI